jgi:hypothetical protein
VVARRGRSELGSEREVTVLRQEHPTEDVADEQRVDVEPEAPVGGDQAVVDAGPPPTTTDVAWMSPAPPVLTSAEAAAPVTTRRPITWGQVLIVLAGAASFVIGIGAVALGGLAGSVTAPIVQVFTFDHTPLLGLIETGAGVVLILCAFLPGGRWIAGPVGVAAIVGGALIIAELDWITTNLAAEQRFGWVAIGIGAVAYLGAMVPTKKRVVVNR